MRKTLDVLISPTTHCNLRCRYCYVDQSSPASVSDIPLKDVKEIYRWLSEYGRIVGSNRIRFTWFGGEPLLRGVEFLRAALEFQKNCFDTDVDIVNAMQSNLTTFSDDLIPLLKDFFQSRIGGSLDFDGDSRVFPNGMNSRQMVEENVKRLQSAGIEVGLVCTLTKQNSSDPQALYEYFKSLGTSFRVNRAAGDVVRLDERLSSDEYGDFVKRLFDVYTSDTNPTVECSNFTMMVRLFLAGTPIICVDPAQPQLYIGIEANGRIMSRCRFAGQIGDYSMETPRGFYEKIIKTAKRHCSPSRCATCEFFGKTCLGGCVGEPDCDCLCSNCGYRTESTDSIWQYIKEYLNSRGHHFGELKSFVK